MCWFKIQHWTLGLILCFHSRFQHLCKFTGTKESVYVRKEFNSHRTCLGHKHSRRFIVLGHKYGRHDVMWKHNLKSLLNSSSANLYTRAQNDVRYITFSITWPASRQIYSNRKKILHSKKVQLPRDWFGTPTWRHGGHIGVPIQWNGGYWCLCSKQILWELISFLM